MRALQFPWFFFYITLNGGDRDRTLKTCPVFIYNSPHPVIQWYHKGCERIYILKFHTTNSKESSGPEPRSEEHDLEEQRPWEGSRHVCTGHTWAHSHGLMFLYLTWPLHQEGHLERKKHNTITPACLKGVLLNCYSLLPYTGTQLPHLLVNFWHKPAISSSSPLLAFNSAFSWNNPTIVIISTFKAMISLAQGVFWP